MKFISMVLLADGLRKKVDEDAPTIERPNSPTATDFTGEIDREATISRATNFTVTRALRVMLLYNTCIAHSSHPKQVKISNPVLFFRNITNMAAIFPSLMYTFTVVSASDCLALQLDNLKMGLIHLKFDFPAYPTPLQFVPTLYNHHHKLCHTPNPPMLPR